MDERFVDIDLAIAPREFERLYSGSASVVVARARDGQMVRFPARVLRSFVLADGIQGCFRIRFGADGRFAGADRLA